MSPALRAGIEIASAISAAVTLAFVITVRTCWRRGKSLQEP